MGFYQIIVILSILLLPLHTICQPVPEYAELLQSYVKIPSEEYKEKEAGHFLLNKCKEKGLYIEILQETDSSFNFVASLYPLSTNKPNIVFLNHIDVVPPGELKKWNYPPYSGILKDSVIWGRGAIDNKGMAIAELLAVSAFADTAGKTNLPFNVSLLCVSGEETGGLRGAKLISERFLKIINPVFMFGEGGSGTNGVLKTAPDRKVFGISVVEKSKIELEVEIDIKSSGHGAVPPREYALKELIFALENVLKKKPYIQYNFISVKALKTLGRYEKGIQGFVQRHFTFFIFKPLVKREIKKDPIILSFFANTITLTSIIIPEGSENMISQNTKAILDCRLLPGQSPERFIKMIKRLVKDDRVTIKPILTISTGPALRNDKVNKILNKSIKQFYPNSVPVEIIFPATSDNSYFRAAGIPVYGIFPAFFTKEELESLHNINERIHLNSLEKSIRIYSELIKECLLQYKEIIAIENARRAKK